MTNVWAGKSMWIWELNKCESGNVSAIIANAKRAGLSSLIVKSHDGTEHWTQFSSNLVQAVHSAGLKIGAWGYCYGKNPEGEAHEAISALAMGADFYVADVEREFDSGSMWGAAERLMSAIKAGAKGKPVGYTSFAMAQLHPGFPFSVFSKYADFTMPQVYWCDLQLPPATATHTSIAYYSKYGVPIVPIGQSYGPVTPAQITQFTNACAGLPGFSFWDYQHATTQMWDAVLGGQVKEVTNVLQRGSEGADVEKLQHELNEVLGSNIAEDGYFGPQTETAVRVFQQHYHLSVDGVVGPQTESALAAALKAKQQAAPQPQKPAQPTPQPTKPAQPTPQPKPAQPAPAPAPAPAKPNPADVAKQVEALVSQAQNVLSQAQNLLKQLQ